MSVKSHEALCFDSLQDKLFFVDDFLGAVLGVEWTSAGGAGGSAAVVDAQTGGIVRLTTDGDAFDAWEIQWNNIRSLLVSKRVSMEVRMKTSDVTNNGFSCYLFFDWSNYIRFGYSAGVGANWIAQCTDGGATTTADSGDAADNSYHIFRIECHTHGGNHVHFYVDGSEIANSPISTNVPDDAADYLQPFIQVETREAVVKTIDLDYVVVRQDR